MPPPQQTKTFAQSVSPLQYIEDILNLPDGYVATIKAMYKRDVENIWLVSVSPSTSGTTEATYLIATNIGEHAVSDIKGVSSSVNIKNLNQPGKVLKALGQSTIQQMADLEEYGADMRREQFKLLVSNQTAQPGASGQIVRNRLGIYNLGPSIFGGKKGTVRILSDDPARAANYESRFYLIDKDQNTGRAKDRGEEEKRAHGDTRKRKKKVYTDLATHFIGVGTYYEDRGSRSSEYKQTMGSFLEIIPEEMRLNNDGTIVYRGAIDPLTGIQQQVSKKEINIVKAIRDTPGDNRLEDFFNNPDEVNKALQLDGLVDAGGNRVNADIFGSNAVIRNEATRTYFRHYAENSYINSVLYADDMVPADRILDFLREVCPTASEFDSMPRDLKRALSNFAGIPEGVNASYENVNRLITTAGFQLDRKNLILPNGRINAAEELSFQLLTHRRGKSVIALHKFDFNIPKVGDVKAGRGLIGLQSFKENLTSRQETLLEEAIHNFRENFDQILEDTKIVARQRYLAEHVNIGNIDDYLNDLEARFKAAYETADLASRMNFMGQTEDYIEAVANDAVLRQFITDQRFPIGKWSTNPLNPIAIARKAVNDTYNNRGIVPHLGISFAVRHEIVEEIPAYAIPQRIYLKIAESPKFRDIIPARNKIWLDAMDANAVTQIDSTIFGRSHTRKFWKRTLVDVEEGKGLFWTKAHVYDTTTHALVRGKSFNTYLSLLDEIGQNQWAEHILSGGDNYKIFGQWANEVILNIQNGITPDATKVEILRKLKFLDDAPGGILRINYTNLGLFENTGLEFELHGFELLNKLERMGFITPGQRLKYVQDIIKSGKHMEFAHYIVGPLNHFNKLANAGKDFFYQEVINGPIGKKIKLNVIFDKLGIKKMPGENWKILTNLKDAKFFKFLSRIGTKFENFSKRFLSKGILRRLAGKGFLAIAKLLGYASSAVTAGISFLLTSLSGAITTFLKNMVLLRPKQAVEEAGKEVQKTVNTFAKIIGWVVGGILFACGSCLFLIIVVIGAIFGALAPKDSGFGGIDGAGTPFTGLAESTLLSASKISAVDLGNENIRYTIRITNITTGTSARDVTIASFSDELSFTPECTGGFGQTHIYGTGGFEGIVPAGEFPNPADIIGTVLTPGETLTIQFNLTDIAVPPRNVTYINNVEVQAEGESDKIARATRVDDIGTGGCSTCPSGWPFDTAYQYRVTQGPGNPYTHGGQEAVDFAPTGGSAIRPLIFATHSGTVYTAYQPNGYGNYVDIVSPRGFRTRYAHLEYASVLDGDFINKGEAVGIMGGSGGWEPHLHYQMIGNDIQCLAPAFSTPIGLVQVDGESYIPETIQRNCGRDTCTQIVP